MARALDTYRGERRLKWKEARKLGIVNWSSFLRPPHGKLTRSTLERQEREAQKRAALQLKNLQNWVLAIRSKLAKRFVLSNREIATFLMGLDAAPPASIDAA